jgi:hypothetical protein
MAHGPTVLLRHSLRWLRPYWRPGLVILGALVAEVGYWTLVPLALRLLIDAAAAGRDTRYLASILAGLGVAFVASPATPGCRSPRSAGCAV